MNTTNDTFSLQYLFSVIVRHRITILVCYLLTLVAVVVASAFKDPVYKSDASLLVKLGREFMYRPEVGGERSTNMFDLDEAINSEIEILESRALCSEVIEELGVEELYPAILEEEADPNRARQKAVRAMQDKLSVVGVADSSVIQASFEHGHPEKAANALNLLLEHFKDRHLEIFSESRAVFLQERAEDLRRNLEAAQAELAEFREENDIFAPEHQQNLLLSRRAQILADLQATETRLNDLRVALPDVQETAQAIPASTGSAGAGDPESGAANEQSDTEPSEFELSVAELEDRVAGLRAELPAEAALTRGVERLPSIGALKDYGSVDDAHRRLLELRLREKQLLADYDPRSRAMGAVADEMSIVKSFLIEAVFDELGALRSQREGYQGQLDEANAQIAKLSSHTGRLVELERRVAAADVDYQNALQHLGDARLTERLDEKHQISVRVIDPATVPLKSIGLSKGLRVLLGAISGLLLGLAIALFSDMLRPQI